MYLFLQVVGRVFGINTVAFTKTLWANDKMHRKIKMCLRINR